MTNTISCLPHSLLPLGAHKFHILHWLHLFSEVICLTISSLSGSDEKGVRQMFPHPQAQTEAGEAQADSVDSDTLQSLLTHPHLFSPSVNIPPPFPSIHSFRHVVWRGASPKTQEHTRAVIVQWQTCFVSAWTRVVCFCPSVSNRLQANRS